MADAFKKWHAKLRGEYIEPYGNKYKCCGETTYEFLTIDHIQGDGDKKEINMAEDPIFFAH
jgi:hypothetical protein